MTTKADLDTREIDGDVPDPDSVTCYARLTRVHQKRLSTTPEPFEWTNYREHTLTREEWNRRHA